MTTHAPIEILFQEASIGTMKLRNRIIMAPMGTNLADHDGFVTENLKAYYAERAKGGCGLIIVEAASIEPRGNLLAQMIQASDDKYLPGLRALVAAIHAGGAKAAIQLAHAGGSGNHLQPGLRAVAPTSMLVPHTGADFIDILRGRTPTSMSHVTELPLELTIAEIKGIIEVFAQAVARVQRAGFDGVELHGAHGVLISQFLSRAWNKRQDEYGGSFENRARFMVELFQAIRARCGRDYPLWIRLSGREFGFEGGITLEEAKAAARLAQDNGSDAIHISAFGLGGKRIPPMSHPNGSLIGLATAVKQVVDVPVIAVGKIDPELGEATLREKRADFIAIGRQLIADPYLPAKVAAGAWDDIRWCLTCQYCQDGRLHTSEPIRCTLNAIAGRDAEVAIAPAAQPKKVMVIGGGPAGMEAARVAAMRGHNVTLYERDAKLGGQLPIAALPPHKEALTKITDYFQRQLDKLGVQVVTGKEATAADVAAMRPDAVIVAAGMQPTQLDLPAAPGRQMVDYSAVLAGQVDVGDNVVIIGAGLVGCETAELLAAQGKKVTVLARSNNVAKNMYPSLRAYLLDRLTEAGVEVLRFTTCERIEADAVVVRHEGEERRIKADTVVVAAGGQPQNSLLEELRGRVAEVYSAGDCVSPRGIPEAVAEGFAAGNQI